MTTFKKRKLRKTWELVRENRMVTLSHIGEGSMVGYYNPNDPEDEPLLRFDIYEMVDGEWEAMDDASYCTGISAFEKPKVIKQVLHTIMDETFDLDRVKKRAERLSWL